MKILRLDLRAYGRFVDKTLDLSAPGLHLFYGRNEAGKSTALRAITSLFYGIGADTADAHSLEPSKLRIGALLCDARGRELYVLRRKGNKNTLQDESGQSLAGSDASWLHAGMSEAQFCSLFGLSYETLRLRADELLQGGGELGESLFGAGVGGRSVHGVLEALRAEADELYRPKGQKQKLNEALSALRSEKEHIRDSALQAEAFSSQEAGIAQSERELRELATRRLSLETERSRLERVRRALPALGKRADALRKRAELGEVRQLPEGASEQRRAALESVRNEKLAVERLQDEIGTLGRQRQALQLPEGLCRLDAAVVDALRERMAAHKRATREVPAKRAALEHAQREAARLAASLAGSVVAAESERGGVAKRLSARIREHSRLRAGVRELESAQRTYAEQRATLERAAAELSALRALVRTSQESSLPAFAALGLPTLESVESFMHALAALERQEQATQGRERELRVLRDQVLLELATLAGEHALPSEAELVALRGRRQRQWAELRALLSRPESAVASYWDHGWGAELLRDFHGTIEQADLLADRLRREAGRVQAHARLTAELASHERGLSQLAGEHAADARARSAFDAQWQALWQAVGINARAPAQMRDWLTQHVAVCERYERLASEHERLQAELQVRQEEYARWQAGWCSLMLELGLAEATTVAEADATLEALAELRAQREAVARLTDERDELDLELQRFEREVEQLAAEHLAGERHPSVQATAEALVNGYQRVQQDLARGAELDARLLTLAKQLEAAQAAAAQAQRVLRSLMAAAQVDDIAGLEQAEQRAAAARELEQKLAEALADLHEASDGLSVEALEQEAQGANLDEVKARLATVGDALETVDEERQELEHRLAGLRVTLHRFRESHGAADAADDAEALVTQIRSHAEHYLRLRLADAVLRREIARYRERHKGPILQGASDAFVALTLGAFSRLEADYDASDEPVLMCVRATGELVPLSGLSDGTRDQLYLALRVASVKHLAASQELMPVVLDDVLVHFDDERAAAALALFGELSSTTQVLFFTHHARLIELARRVLPAGQLMLHELAEAANASPVLGIS